MKTDYEAIFRASYPRATIESQKTRGPGGKRYYLVRKTRSTTMYSGSGSTKLGAWRDAASHLSDAEQGP